MAFYTAKMNYYGMNEAASFNMAGGDNSAWTCGACGMLSASTACFCTYCGASAYTETPLKITPGEPVYILSKDLNICPPSATEPSYIQIDSAMKAKAPALKLEKLNLFDLIGGSPMTHSMEHDGIIHDVSDGASTTVSDNDSSGRSFESEVSSPCQEPEVTTLMVCPLPYEVSSDMLLQAVEDLGFAGSYDFVYMPSRSTRKGAKCRKGNVGYSFVNFATAQRATEFATAFEGYSFPDVDAEKLVSVKPAACQGYTANYAMYLANKKKKQGDFMTFPLTKDFARANKSVANMNESIAQREVSSVLRFLQSA
jgi:hypothetical protein